MLLTQAYEAVIPAEAGTQRLKGLDGVRIEKTLGPGFRRDDETTS